MGRRMPALAAAGVIIAVLSACAPASGSSSGLATYPRPDAGMDALLEGRLDITPRCVSVESGGVRSIPVFPEGDAEVRDGVLHWRGDTYADGDEIALGGGFLPSGGDIPPGCGDQPEALFFVSPY